jgi:hypothetical protein
VSLSGIEPRMSKFIQLTGFLIFLQYLIRGFAVTEGPWPPHIGRFLKLFTYLVVFLVRVISLSQGLYLHRTAQHKETKDRLHALSRNRSHDHGFRATRVQAPNGAVPVSAFIRLPSFNYNNSVGCVCINTR